LLISGATNAMLDAMMRGSLLSVWESALPEA
jgi:hypothetical protein